MGYFLADEVGFLNDFASIGGGAQFRKWAYSQGGVLAEFMRDGEAPQGPLLVALKASTTDDPDIADMRETLLEAADEAYGNVILSDGGDGGGEDEEDDGGDGQEASAVTPAGYTTADKPPSYKDGWWAIDLDGSIATHTTNGTVGKPIASMVERVKEMLAKGKDVRIFTARKFDTPETRQMIESWCEKNIGKVLPITNVKHPGVRAIFDDRAVSLVKNTGEPRHDIPRAMRASADSQELAGNPNHDKVGRFASKGASKRAKVPSKATNKVDSMSAESFTQAIRAVTGRHDYTGVKLKGGLFQINKEFGPGNVQTVKAKSWSAALKLATAKWGAKP